MELDDLENVQFQLEAEKSQPFHNITTCLF